MLVRTRRLDNRGLGIWAAPLEELFVCAGIQRISAAVVPKRGLAELRFTLAFFVYARLQDKGSEDVGDGFEDGRAEHRRGCESF